MLFKIVYSLEHWDVSALLEKCVIFIHPVNFFFFPCSYMLWPYFLSGKYLLLLNLFPVLKIKFLSEDYTFLGRWSCVISAKHKMLFQVLLQQKQAILWPLVTVMLYAKYIEI